MIRSFRGTIALMVVLISPALAQRKHVDERELFTQQVFAISSVLLHDGINPPAAARFYAYSMLAAYAVIQANNDASKNLYSLTSQFVANGPDETIHQNFAAAYAMLETASLIVPSGDLLQETKETLVKAYQKNGVGKNVLDHSVRYAKKVAKEIVHRAKADGYFSLSVFERYQPLDVDSTWLPTPPQYMMAIEPRWSTIKTFFLDSCKQVPFRQPAPYSTRPGTVFHAMTQEVYAIGNNINEEQRLIANYWDCNPFASLSAGHVKIGVKKISPGGHWMSIAGIACKKARLSFDSTVWIHALVAMGIHDGFVSCWDVKYITNRVRPETVIKATLDENWTPLLETPPFPEYTSGHSVISTIAAELLSYTIGDDFAFTDTSETMFGLPPRKFNSFRHAAEEAAVSRLYGGIHFRDAIEEGQRQGREISEIIKKKIKIVQY